MDTESVPAPAAPQPPPDPKPVTISELPPAQNKAVYADIVGTLAAISSIGAMQWMMKRYLGTGLFLLWQLGLIVKAPYWFVLSCVNRKRLYASISYEFAGMDCDDAKELSEVFYRGYVKPRLFPDAMKTLRDLAAKGYRVVLVTSDIDFLMQPLARDLKADLIAPRLVEMNDEFTGALDGEALIDERKANAVRAHAEEHGIDLGASYAYGNDVNDLQMLECVGHPVAVNPDRRIAAVAGQKEWTIERWRGAVVKSRRPRGEDA